MAVEDRRSFRVESSVEAEKSNIAGNFDPLASDVLMANTIAVTVVANGRNFGLVATGPFVVHFRCIAVTARG